MKDQLEQVLYHEDECFHHESIYHLPEIHVNYFHNKTNNKCDIRFYLENRVLRPCIEKILKDWVDRPNFIPRRILKSSESSQTNHHTIVICMLMQFIYCLKVVKTFFLSQLLNHYLAFSLKFFNLKNTFKIHSIFSVGIFFLFSV